MAVSSQVKVPCAPALSVTQQRRCNCSCRLWRYVSLMNLPFCSLLLILPTEVSVTYQSPIGGVHAAVATWRDHIITFCGLTTGHFRRPLPSNYILLRGSTSPWVVRRGPPASTRPTSVQQRQAPGHRQPRRHPSPTGINIPLRPASVTAAHLLPRTTA